LCHTNGGEIEQIQFLLGHASVQTTERYLGCKQNLGHPVNDRDIAVAAQARFWGETDGLTTKTGRTQLDKISVHESRGDHEGSDKRTGTSVQGNGHARCDGSGEEFILFHDPTFVDNETAARQAQWLEKVLAEEHERERKHPDRIQLLD
jgi:poly(3-hydroxybutyrate) depolymerase